MFIALGFLRSFHAEGVILQAKLRCERAGRTDACLLLGNAHETLPDQTKNKLLCIFGTGSIGWTFRAGTYALVSLHFLVQLCL